MRRKNFAVSAVLGTILVLMIVVAAISSVLLWVNPYIEKTKVVNEQKSVLDQFTAAEASISHLIQEGPGAKRVVSVGISENLGSINIDPVGDRFIAMYAMDSDYNFVASGLDDGDNEFSLDLSQGTKKTIDICRVYKLADDPVVVLPVCEQASVLDKQGRIHSFLKFDLTPIYELEEDLQLYILSATLKFYVNSEDYLVRWDYGAEFYHVDDQSWDDQLSCVSLLNLPLPNQVIDTNFCRQPGYTFSSNLRDIVMIDYNSKKDFCSIDVVKLCYPPQKPVNYLFNLMPIRSNKCYFSEPQLAINYLEMKKEASVESVDDKVTNTKDNTIKPAESYVIDEEKSYWVSPYAKEKKNPDGSYTQSISVSPGAFYNENDDLEEINTNIINKPASEPDYDYGVENGVYKAYFKVDPTKPGTVKFYHNQSTLYLDKKIDGQILLQPKELTYCTANGETQLISKVLPVNGYSKENEFAYPGIYGSGINLVYEYLPSITWKKLFIEQRDLLPEPSENIGDSSKLTVDLSMILQPRDNLCIFVDGKPWDENSEIRTQNQIELRDRTTNELLFSLPSPLSWDAQGNQIHTSYVLKKEQNQIYLTVKTPYSWLIDPTTIYPVVIDDSFSFSTPAEDGDISYNDDLEFYVRDKTDTYLVIASSMMSPTTKAYVEWDVSSIQDNADVTDTVFYYHGKTPGTNNNIYSMENRPSTSSDATLYADCADGTIFALFSIVAGTNKFRDLGTDADTDLESQLSSNWFAIGIIGGNGGQIYSKEYASSTPKPRLDVTYTIPFTVTDSASPNPQASGQPVNFIGTVTAPADSTPPYAFTWNFGDGSSPVTYENQNSPVSTSHTYTSDGTYSVTLTVTDSSASPKIAIATPLSVVITQFFTVTDHASPSTQNAGKPVTFTGTVTVVADSTPPYAFTWNFGDGSPVTYSGKTSPFIAYHTYANKGNYLVTLTVTDSSASPKIAIAIPLLVVITPSALTATITSPDDGSTVNVDDPVQFSSLPGGGTAPYTYSWDFDDSDGIPVDSTQPNPPEHTYTTPRILPPYTAILTVTDSSTPIAQVAIDSVDVFVNPGEGAPEWEEFIDYDTSSLPGPTYTVDSNTINLEGAICIHLIKINALSEEEIVGKIWLFDMGSIKSTLLSSFGTYENIIENGGILSVSPGGTYFSEEPYMYEDAANGLLSFRIRLIRPQTGGSSAGGGSFSYDLKLKHDSSLVRETEEQVYNLKLQIYNNENNMNSENADTWINYFDEKTSFVKHPTLSNTLNYVPTNPSLTLTLTSSIIKAELTP